MGPLSRRDPAGILPDTPAFVGGGVPPVAWEQASRGLWCQVLPEWDAVWMETPGEWSLADVRTGAVRWRRRGEAAQEVRAAGDLLCIGGRSRLHALERATGETRWSLDTRSAVSSLVGHGDRIVAAAGDRLLGIAAQNGALNWRLPTGEEPVLRSWGGLVLAEETRFGMRGVDPQRGRVMWEFQPCEQLSAGDPTESLLPIALGDEGLAAVHPGDGRVLWTHAEPALQVLAESGGVVVLDARCLSLRDAVDGRSVWSRELPLSESDRAFAVRRLDNRLLVDTWGGQLHALDAGAGEHLWSRQVGSVQRLCRLTGGDVLLLSTRPRQDTPGKEDWVLACLDARDGGLRWEGLSVRAVSDLTVCGDRAVVEPRERILVLDVSSDGGRASCTS